MNSNLDKGGISPEDVPADAPKDVSIDACENVNVSAKKRRYVPSSSSSNSEDMFIAKKMGKSVPSSSVKEIFDITRNDNDEGLNFEKEKELLEDRNIRKELQEALDRIKQLEEQVNRYEEKDKEKEKRIQELEERI